MLQLRKTLPYPGNKFGDFVQVREYKPGGAPNALVEQQAAAAAGGTDQATAPMIRSHQGGLGGSERNVIVAARVTAVDSQRTGYPDRDLAGVGVAFRLVTALAKSFSRGKTMSDDFRSFLEAFRVVTPLDLRRPDVRARRDIVERKLEELKQEAPFAYKGIGPVVRTLAGAGLARPVAELRPLLTVKG